MSHSHPAGTLISHSQVWLCLRERLQKGRPSASSKNPGWVPEQRAQEIPQRTSTHSFPRRVLFLFCPPYKLHEGKNLVSFVFYF